MDWSDLLSTPIGELLGRRKATPRGRPVARPATGATLCCAGLRMTVQAGMTDDLWQWLSGLGWRELQPRENRLHFRPLATALVNRLIDGPSSERDRVLLAAIRHAASDGRTTRVIVPPRVPSRLA